MSDYVSRVSADLQQRYAGQPEYLQAVLTWLEMIAPALEDNPIYERVDLLTRMVEPDRMLTFTVPWMDDQGMAHTNHGYRVQFNSAIGPYKGGLRFHPSVNPSIVKFLGFEQTYKNALTGLPIGGADKVEPYADRFGVEFFPGKRPWEVPVDIVIPCATQNELDVEDAVMIVANNVRYYVEAANMPATAEALRLLRLSPKILTAGSKASGSGGVVVSALEMVQNSLRYSWTRQEVDSRLKQIMGGIYDASAAAAEEYGLGYDLIAGNDIAAFKKISTAMIAQGL